jgi:hypothetical protein
VRRGARVTGLLVQVLLLAKAVAVAIGAPEDVWPAAEPPGNVGLLAMFLSIGVSVICSGGRCISASQRWGQLGGAASSSPSLRSRCRGSSRGCLSAALPQLL